ncbi:MAG: dihydrofolate reductase family protein [Herpetosiphonaceae bacterium]|nr:dihydrofolate reductase family protein [Herpetosiphonaceae bacterium]
MLPPTFAKLYSSWPLLPPAGCPYVYANFVMSRDGRVSFNIPRHMGGGDVSRRNVHDRWLMGLLRARADAVLIGGSSLANAGNHIWTPDAVFTEDSAAWQTLREQEGRSRTPMTVIMTRSGTVTALDAPTFRTPGLRVLLATTRAGVQAAAELLHCAPHVEVYAPDDTLDMEQLLRQLHRNYGVNTLLCEGGPQVYGSLHAAGMVNDEFVTLSPILIGNSPKEPRPSLVEGIAFSPEQPPQSKLLSLHRSGDYLFLHSRYDPSR